MCPHLNSFTDFQQDSLSKQRYAAPMWIRSLTLNHFRNFSDLSLRIDAPAAHVLLGQNGVGKTNLLEALSLLAPGQGLHRAKLEDMRQHGSKSWQLFAEVENAEGMHKVGIGFGDGRRQMRLNGADLKSQADLAHLGTVLWFTPEMDRLFSGSPGDRRRFLDRLVFGHTPAHAAALNRYNRHIQNRNRLLKDADRSAPDPLWLEAEENAAATAAVAVLRNRAAYLEALQPQLRTVTLKLSGSAEKLAADEHDDTALHQLLLDHWAQDRQRDGRYGSTHFGPHRTDLSGTLGDIPLHLASMGQHKRAVLTILLANAELLTQKGQQPPCLLLDEVAAHLDADNRKLLYHELVPLGGQLWMTGTDENVFADLPNAQVLRVHGGNISS